MFKTAQEAKDYLFAGKGVITLRSAKSGAHFTYKIAQPKDHVVGGPLFVSVLTANGEYRYLGILNAAREFRTTAKSCPARDSKVAAAFKFCVDGLNRGMIPEMLEISHEGRCGHCARLITTPGSLASGIGPECAAKVGVPSAKLARAPAVKRVDPIVAEARARAERERAEQTEFWRGYSAAPASGPAAILDRFAAVHC